MPPAVIGGVIAGVGAIGASVIGSKANSKAIGQASDAQAEAAREATALQKQIYQQNVGYQTPYLNTGNAAMAQINALLGLQVPQQAAPQPGTVTNPGQQQGAVQPLQEGANLLQTWRHRIQSGQATIDQAPTFVRFALKSEGLGSAAPSTSPINAPNVPTVSQPTAQAAYDQFKNYTGYQTRLTEANNSLNSAYAAKGTLQSGAALQAMARMNQDYASGEFGNYMSYLGGQQQLGPGAANALGGVGTNYANNAGNIAMQNGNNMANAAIARANNTNQMWGGIANGIGGMAGSIFGGSSYGGWS